MYGQKYTGPALKSLAGLISSPELNDMCVFSHLNLLLLMFFACRHAVLPSSRPMTPMEQMSIMLKQEKDEDSNHGEPSERDMEVNNLHWLPVKGSGHYW